jgi:putative DNA primase/helicase
MVYAKRGVGKTHFALGMAVAVASGGTFLKYKAPKPRQMLYIDGEMPRYDILRRLKAAPAAQELSSAYFQILSASDNDLQLPDLGTDGGRRAFTELIAPFDFIVLDNLSSLAPTLKENEGDSWAPIQHWLLNARSKGKSLMLVHHGGKSGGQRGTSRKEDVLDTIIELVEPPGKTASAGAVFDVHLTKSRSCLGKPAGSFSARLSPDTGEWTVTDIGQKEAEDHARIRQLREEGKTIREINELTGVPKSTVDRMLKAGEET